MVDSCVWGGFLEKLEQCYPFHFRASRTLVLLHIRATSPSSFSTLTDYSRSVGLDYIKLAQIVTDLLCSLLFVRPTCLASRLWPFSARRLNGTGPRVGASDPKTIR
jgi:hypothetical protein